MSLLNKLFGTASTTGSITVNGKTYSNLQGENLSIVGGRVYLDGEEVTDGEIKTSVMTIKVEGLLAYLNVREGNVEVAGNVQGSIDAGGNIVCGDVGEYADAGGNIACKGVGGKVDAGGNVSVSGDVQGEIDAGGNVSVAGNARGGIDAGNVIVGRQ